jgi:hypothetical protein
MSLRARSISITCSATSFGSFSSSCASSASRSGVEPRVRVPAIGRSVTLRLPPGEVFVAHQDFRRRADDLHVAEVVVVHVRRGIQRTQRAVQRQRRIDIGLADALADLHLHQVAGHHVFLGHRHRLQVVLLAEVAHRFGAHRGSS